MGSSEAPLFREEVAQKRADRLHGSVSLATPLAWQAIGFLLLVALVISIVFLAMASYARVETVSGAVTLDKGLATIIPSRSGVVAALKVSEGQRVRAGELLARIRSEEDMIDGNTAPTRIRRALDEADSRLEAQGKSLLAAAHAQQERLREQISGLLAEQVSVARQISGQRRLVDLATADYESVQRLAANGFISRRDMETRQATLLSRQQQLAQLEQLGASKAAAIAEARRAMTEASATAQAQVAGAQSQRAVLAQQLAQAELARGYAITSPVDGVVTALIAHLGQPVNSQQQLMIVVPEHAKPRIELYVPTAAAGFLSPGQEVRLAIDAFPYQRFGTVSAQVSNVSGTTIVRQESKGPIPVYLVTATLDQPWIKAFSRRQLLSPGMTLTARIVTEKRSLLEWLFEPIFAVRNR